MECDFQCDFILWSGRHYSTISLHRNERLAAGPMFKMSLLFIGIFETTSCWCTENLVDRGTYTSSTNSLTTRVTVRLLRSKNNSPLGKQAVPRRFPEFPATILFPEHAAVPFAWLWYVEWEAMTSPHLLGICGSELMLDTKVRPSAVGNLLAGTGVLWLQVLCHRL